MIPPRTDDELKQIALDLHQGRIFTDRHCPDPETFRMVFMLFVFMTEEHLDQLKADPPGLIFEYLDQAGPRSVNGMPSFFSCQMLNKADTDRVFALYEQLRIATEAALS
jgi:hypothetical protein